MRLYSRGTIVLVLAAVLPGCPRYSTELSRTLDASDVWWINVDAPSYGQVVKVAVTSPVPVSVYVVLESESEGVRQKLQAQEVPDSKSVLASAVKLQDGVVEAKVPKKHAYGVFIAGAAKSSDVKVKISGS